MISYLLSKNMYKYTTLSVLSKIEYSSKVN